MSRSTARIILAASCAALVTFDRAVPEIGTGPLYIPLIAFAGWRLGVREACAVAFAAVLLNVFPHYAAGDTLQPVMAVARGVTRVGAYAFVVAIICALRRAYDRERAAARHDALTGVPGRAAFETRARAALEDAVAGSPVRVLALADIDGFKAVNDVEGHAAGDEALRLFAAVATATVERNDGIGRLGGDEFVFLLEADTVDAARSRTEALHLGLSNGLSRPGRRLGVSMGAVILPPGATWDYDATLRRADALMYAAKAAGKGGLRCETDVGAIRPMPTPARPAALAVA